MMRRIGACIVDPVEIPTANEIFQDNRAQEMLVLRREFKVRIARLRLNSLTSQTRVASIIISPIYTIVPLVYVRLML